MSATPPPIRSVLLGLDPRDSYQRDIIDGVLRFCRTHTTWELRLAPDLEAITAHLSQGDPTSGLITTELKYPPQAGRRTPPLATVLVMAAGPRADLSVVTDSEEATARMALEHLRKCGMRRLAFLDHQAPPSARRLAFEAEVHRAGLECHSFPPVGASPEPSWHRRTEAIAGWIAGLAKPIGAFCFHTEAAQQLVTACTRRQIRVPQEVAVLACGGDELVCHLVTPPLSTVEPGGDRIGHEAARRLAELMDGGDPTPTFVRFEPLAVTRRQSTDLRAVDDPHVAAAIRMVDEEVREGITVADVVRRLPLSRRQLDYAFRRMVGKSLHEYIRHERIERAKLLLVQTNLPLTTVAGRSGFTYPTRLSEAFRKEMEMTPTEYRQRNQMADWRR